MPVNNEGNWIPGPLNQGMWDEDPTVAQGLFPVHRFEADRARFDASNPQEWLRVMTEMVGPPKDPQHPFVQTEYGIAYQPADPDWRNWRVSQTNDVTDQYFDTAFRGMGVFEGIASGDAPGFGLIAGGIMGGNLVNNLLTTGGVGALNPFSGLDALSGGSGVGGAAFDASQAGLFGDSLAGVGGGGVTADLAGTASWGVNEAAQAITKGVEQGALQLTDVQQWAQQLGGLNADGTIKWAAIDASPTIQSLGYIDSGAVIPGWDQWISQNGSSFTADPSAIDLTGNPLNTGPGPLTDIQLPNLPPGSTTAAQQLIDGSTDAADNLYNPPVADPITDVADNLYNPPADPGYNPEQPGAPVQEGPTNPSTGPSGSLPPITTAANALEKILNGTATAADWAKLLGLGGLLGLGISENGQNNTSTQTTTSSLPDWYTAAVQDLISKAKNITPSSAWKPYEDKAQDYFARGTALNTSAEPYLDRAGELFDASTAPNTAWQGDFNTARDWLNASAAPNTAWQGDFNTARDWLNASTAPNTAWQPYMDRATELTNLSARTLPEIDLNTYMNPYLQSVLDPLKARYDVDVAGRLNEINSQAAMRNAFGTNRNALISSRAQGEADRVWNENEANIRKGAFDFATNAALTDLTRLGAAGTSFANFGKTAGGFTQADLERMGLTGRSYADIGAAAGRLTQADLERMGLTGRSFVDTGTAAGRLTQADLERLNTAGTGYTNLGRTAADITNADLNRLLSAGSSTIGQARDVGALSNADALLPIVAGGTALSGVRLPVNSTVTTTNPPPSMFGQVAGALTAAHGLGIV